MTPVYSQRNGTTIVKLELTDYIEEIRNNCYSNNNEIAFVITAYDYAMNTATYEIGMPYNYVDFFMDGLTDNTLTMSPNEVYNMMPYIISLVVLAFTSKKSRAPKAEGIPYDKGSR